jgi:spermidine synthase
VIGLGAGSVACYAEPGQRWDFYEIDPTVTRIARDPRYFTYLADCAPDATITLGDARLSLARATATYDLMILDAYSSDAVPVHLLTHEAIALYLAHLRAGGILAFHVSNRHVDLEPVLSDLAHDAGLAALIQVETAVAPEDAARGRIPSRWIAIARTRDDLGPLVADPRWHPLRPGNGTPWTDERSSVLRVLRLS